MKGHCTDSAGCAEKSRRLIVSLEENLAIGIQDHEEILKHLAAGLKIGFDLHLERRMVLRALSEKDIREVIECGEVFQYQELEDGWYSIVIMGTIADGRCVHVVVRYTWDENRWYIRAITAYDPSVTAWMWDSTLNHRVCFCVPEAVYTEEGDE